jgi:hypothetical protein
MVILNSVACAYLLDMDTIKEKGAAGCPLFLSYNSFSFNNLFCSLSNSLGYILDIPQKGQNSISGHVPFFVCSRIKMLATPAQ